MADAPSQLAEQFSRIINGRSIPWWGFALLLVSSGGSWWSSSGMDTRLASIESSLASIESRLVAVEDRGQDTGLELKDVLIMRALGVDLGQPSIAAADPLVR